MNQNELIKNLYIQQIYDGSSTNNKVKRIKPKELAIKTSEKNDFKELPALNLSSRGGNVIIQNWSTKIEIPPDITNINLPIILDKTKILEFNKEGPNKKELDKQEQDKMMIRKSNPKVYNEMKLLGNIPKNMGSLISLNLRKSLNATEVSLSSENNSVVLSNQGPSKILELPSGNEEHEIMTIVPYTSNGKKLTKHKKLNKKELVDFSIYNKNLFLKDNEFLYLKRVGNPVEFVECDYSDLIPKDQVKKLKGKLSVEYLTMSRNTIMHFKNGNTSLYSVIEWRENYIKFKKLIDIKLFKNFKIAKIFELWKKLYKRMTKTIHIEKLKKRLPHLEDALLKGLKEIREIIKEMSTINIFKIELKDPIDLPNFQEEHEHTLITIDNHINKYRTQIKKAIQKACNLSYKKYKDDKRITLDDEKQSNEKNEAGGGDKKSNLIKDSNLVQNFLKDAMPYAQDATRRIHYKKLLKFIRVVDFMFNEAKYNILYKSLESLNIKLNRVYDPPLIIIYDLPLKDKFLFMPPIDQVQKVIMEKYIQEKIYTVIYRKSFIDPQEFPNYMICFEEVFDSSVDQNANLNIRIKENKNFSELFKKIRNTLNKCCEDLENYAKSLLPLLLNYNNYSNINFQALEQNSTPEELKELLQKFINESKTISSLKQKVNIGIFQFSLANLIDKVSQSPVTWINEMRQLIPRVLINKLKIFIGVLNNHMKHLTIQPNNVETFITLKLAVHEIEKQKIQIDTQNTEINDLIAIIREDSEIKIQDFDLKLIREKESLYVEFERKFDSVVYEIENEMVRRKKELKDQIASFEKEIKNLIEELNVDILNMYNEDSYSAIFYLENKSVIIQKYTNRMEYFRDLENKIEMEEKSNFQNLEFLQYEYDLKYKLWKSVSEFQTNSKLWENSQVMQINIEEMEEMINRWIEIGKVTLIDLEFTDVPKILLENVKKFALILQILKTIQNVNVNTYYKFVDEISKILAIEITITDMAFTIKSLLEMDELNEKIEKLSETNNKADEEERVRQMYNVLLTNYKEKRIPLKLERANKQQVNDKNLERWVIGSKEFEIEYDWIEENLMTLKKILLNPCSIIIEDDLKNLYSNYVKYNQFLDEFYLYQKYLNKTDTIIIYNPEFHRDMPNEHKRFSNDTWVKTLAKFLKETLLPRYIDNHHDKAIIHLKNANKNYEELFKSIEEFLDKKRREIPKYYFLSNEDIIDLFANPDTNEVRKKYLPKLINGIRGVEFSNDTEEVIRIITNEGEVITTRYTKGKSTLREVVEFIEPEIQKKIKLSFRTFKKDLENSYKNKSDKRPKDVIMDIVKSRDHLFQSIFNFIYSYYIDSLEKALSNPEEAFDKLIDIMQYEIKERKKALITMLKNNQTTNLEKLFMINLISLENYFIDVIKNLIREDCHSIADFNWMKVLQIKIEFDQCAIKIFNFNFDYGYDYVGLHHNFILTPQTNRIFLTIANCFYIKRPCFIYGLSDCGKKETVKQLSKIFGKSMIIFDCSERFDVKSFNKQLFGCLKSGTWLCLDRMNLISIEVLSIIAQELMSVYRTMSDPKEPGLIINPLTNDKISLDKGSQIVCINHIEQKGISISSNIKNYFRLIGICLPDLSLFIHSSLKNIAFPKVKKYASKIKFVIEYLNTRISCLGNKMMGFTLFNKLFSSLFKYSNRITIENSDKLIRKAFDRTFVPFMTDLENEEMMRLINNVFETKSKTLFSYSSMVNEELDDIIKNATKDYSFQNDLFLGKIKNVLMSLESKDNYLFVGPPLTGKSTAFEMISKISEKLSQVDPIENPLIMALKIFPKAYDPYFLFNEVEKYSILQFSNIYFNNQIKLFEKQIKSKKIILTGSSKSGSEFSTPVIQTKRTNNFSEFESKWEGKEKTQPTLKFLYFDGQIDSSWIDYLNMFYTNNKTHCMSNGDTLRLSEYKVLFETLNLTYATPSFITKNFIVSFDYSLIKWENILYRWINSSDKINSNMDLKHHIRGLFENYFPKLSEFINSNKLQSINFYENYVIRNLINLFESILPIFDFEDKKVGRKNLNKNNKIDFIKKSTLSIFIFSAAWTVYFLTNFILKTKIEKLISDMFKADDLKGPIFDYFIDDTKIEFELWSHKLESSQDYKRNQIQSDIYYNKVFIPSVENISYQWIVEKFISNNKPVFYTGLSSSGKTTNIKAMLNLKESKIAEFLTLNYLINYNSSSKKFENFLFDNLTPIKRNLLGDTYGRETMIFVDDLNLQQMDNFKSQSVQEYIRQLLNLNSIYDMKSNKIKNLFKVNFLCCGNVSSLPTIFNMERFIHSFNLVLQNPPSEDSLSVVFKINLEYKFRHYLPNISSSTANQFVQATLNVYNYVRKNFKTSPKKLHYKFDLRQVNKIFEALHHFNFDAENFKSTKYNYLELMEKLWFYENSRVYEDMMIKEDDKDLFRKNVIKIFSHVLKKDVKFDEIYKKDFIFAYYNLNGSDNNNNLVIPPNRNSTKNIKNEENFEKDGNILNNNQEMDPNRKTTSNLLVGSSNDITSNTIKNMSSNNLREKIGNVSSRNLRVKKPESTLNMANLPYQSRNYEFYEEATKLFNTLQSTNQKASDNSKFRHIIFNKSTIDLVLRLMRSLDFKKEHIILIAPTLAGKMSITQYTGFLLNKTFYDIEEALIMPKPKENTTSKQISSNNNQSSAIYVDKTLLNINIQNNQKESVYYIYIKKVLAEIVSKNKSAILFFNNLMLEQEEILEMINNLMNTDDIFNHFEFVNFLEKDSNGFLPFDRKEIISRIEDNLSIVMCPLPNSIAYKKLFYNYSFISKNSNKIFINKWQSEAFLDIIRRNVGDSIKNFDQKYGNFGEMLLEMHKYIKNLANEYSSKLLCKVEISSKNFISMIEFYGKNFKRYHDYINNQKKKYDMAVEVIPKMGQILKKLSEELQKLEPLKNENEKSMEDKKAEMSKRHYQKAQVSNSKAEEEKPYNIALNQLDDLIAKREKHLERNLDRVRKAKNEIKTKLTDRNMLFVEFKTIIEGVGHNLSKFILTQIYSILGENTEWEYIKKSLDPKIFKNLVEIEFTNYQSNFVDAVREIVQHAEFMTSENIAKTYRVCGILCDYFMELNNYFTEYENIKPLLDEIQELNKKIAGYEKIQKGYNDNIVEISQQISAIERDFSTLDKRKQTIMAQIEKREALKKICDEFLEVASEKSNLWKEKQAILESTLENIEFYVLYISIYIFYAPPFNNSYRKKIRNYLFTKAEEAELENLKIVDFYSIIMEFLDIRGADRELIFSLGTFDEYSRENLLLMYLHGKKIPFIIDNYRISKLYLCDYLQWKDTRKILVTRQGDSDFNEKLEYSLKEGYSLFIEQVEDKLYNIIKYLFSEENKFSDKGKTFVMIEGVPKEYNDKFKLYLLKDKIDTKINTKFWLDSLVINFLPSFTQLKTGILYELAIIEDSNIWNSYSRCLQDITKDMNKLNEIEDRINGVFNQFDYTGNVDKNNSNANFLNTLKNETAQHTNMQNLIKSHREKVFRHQAEINFKFKALSEDASKLYKCMAKFNLLDNIYNFSFHVFCKFIKEFYKENVSLKKQGEYTSEKNLLSLILFIYEKTANVFSFDERKLLLFVMITFYLNKIGEIGNSYKSMLKNVKYLFFDKHVKFTNSDRKSPLIQNLLNDFQWNCLNEISDQSNGSMHELLSHIEANVNIWEDYLAKDNLEEKECFDYNFDKVFNKRVDILVKLIFMTVIRPFKFQQLLQEFFQIVIGKSFRIPQLKLQAALASVSNRKILYIIDEEYLSEKEVISSYAKKYAIEGTQFYNIINITTDLPTSQLESLLNTIRTPSLLIMRNIHLAKNSVIKLIETINDPRTFVNEAFRLIFITKSNVVLTSQVYDNCLILNRNKPKSINIKDTIQDIIEAADSNLFTYAINRNYNALYSRKIFFHLVIVHAMMKQFNYYVNNIAHTIPIEYNQRDFFNCFYFVANYLQQIGESQENINNNPNNYNDNNYISLMNTVFESFYCSRLVYREEINKTMKILQKFIEHDKFYDELFYFFYDNKSIVGRNEKMISDKKIEILNNNESNLTKDDLARIIDEIPLDAYYDMIVNIPSYLISSKLSEIAEDFFKDLAVVQSMIGSEELIHIKIEKNKNKLFQMENQEKIVASLMDTIPKILKLDDIPTTTFKLNKYGEYVNPIDESLKHEVACYNDYLKSIDNDIEIINKIYNGQIYLSEEFYELIFDLCHNVLPARWKSSCFNLAKSGNEKISLSRWNEELNRRIDILQKWLMAPLSVYPINLFYSIKLFLFSILIHFSKKVGISPEKLKLKFFLTNFNSLEEMEKNQNLVKKFISENGGREVIFSSGFMIENAELDRKELALINQMEKGGNATCPIIAISYCDDENELNNEEENYNEDEESFSNEDNPTPNYRNINIPIFGRVDSMLFSNLEPIGQIQIKYDDSCLKEDFWISKGVRIVPQF